MKSLALVLSSLLLITGCGEQTPARQSTPMDLTGLSGVAVTSQNTEQQIELDGTVEAVNRAVVSAQTSGRVTALPFDVGDQVNAGDVIAQITSEEQQAAVNSAMAQVNEARARFAEADAQLTRIADVFKKGVVSKAEFDQVKAAQQSAEARVTSAEAALSDAKQRLQYTQVIAPYSGILVRRLVDVGATVAPGTPLLEGVSLADVRIRVNVPQNSIQAVRKYRKAQIMLADGSMLESTDLRISPSADASSHSFLTLVEIPQNASNVSLLPGSLTKVAFVTGTEQQLVIPKNAVAQRGEVSAVYVINQQQLVFRYIRLGKTMGDKVVVQSGLAENDQIASDVIQAAAIYKQSSVAAQ
ncbi:efflux RND transporter periplasmic adaptor subunit [Neptunicella marina]|uniref:Efflux RND transporter periplasmic adaptor subunit n=1 Tax=Neptunicella marina TaxID=2125989 RepID=A0A8J6ITK2_9ALTE|nr:efflux RND transporter periplasmic adaptor subunit [Neptunicella marina]MBC3765552.1 efflux RND transporter periplasmic adaptor subunit [Neptunicella marina]